MLHDAACPVSFVYPLILLLWAFKVKRIPDKGDRLDLITYFCHTETCYKKK